MTELWPEDEESHRPDTTEATARAALFLTKTPEAAIGFLERDSEREHTQWELEDIRAAIEGIREGIYK